MKNRHRNTTGIKRTPIEIRIRVAMGDRSWCGSACGLPIGVSWGEHGYAGGVIDRKEIAALVKVLNDYLEGKS